MIRCKTFVLECTNDAAFLNNFFLNFYFRSGEEVASRCLNPGVYFTPAPGLDVTARRRTLPAADEAAGGGAASASASCVSALLTRRVSLGVGRLLKPRSHETKKKF